MLNKRILITGAVGYGVSLITSPFVPEVFSLLIPVTAVLLASIVGGKRPNLPNEIVPEVEAPSEPQALPAAQQAQQQLQPKQEPAAPVSPEFAPVLEYLEVLEDMIISEGQKNNLDDEIVEKSLALFARLQRVIPLLQELNNGNINHDIRRLVLRDLNGFITPFLRLSGETKTKNRRMLLNGLKDVNAKITAIVETIEHKDLIELQTRADLIHRRYNDTDHF